MKQFLTSLRQLMSAFRPAAVKGQAAKPKTRFPYRQGPMAYLADKIVKEMELAGYPALVHCVHRSAEDQAEAQGRGASRAGPFQSPHQFSEAADIVHAQLFWQAPTEFWDTLAEVARLVAERHGVELELGYDWGWDLAHIELKDWRTVRDRIGHRHPTQDELDRRFAEVLPKTWQQFLKSARAKRSPHLVG